MIRIRVAVETQFNYVIVIPLLFEYIPLGVPSSVCDIRPHLTKNGNPHDQVETVLLRYMNCVMTLSMATIYVICSCTQG